MIPPLARRMGVLAASFFLLASGLPTGGPGPARAAGTVDLTTLDAAYAQDFDTLAFARRARPTRPDGLGLRPSSGTNANTTYAAGARLGDRRRHVQLRRRHRTPSAPSAPSAAGRSCHRSASSSRTTRAPPSTPGSDVTYTGEQWRLGQVTAGRAADRLDVQLSTDATFAHDRLHCQPPGRPRPREPRRHWYGRSALNGNVAPNRTLISLHDRWAVGSLTAPRRSGSGGRTIDLSPGSDDGLGIDDFSLTPNGVVADTAPSVSNASPADGSTDVPLGANLSVTFGEAVNVSGDWFRLACPTSGTRDVADTAVSGGPTTFTIDPVLNLAHRRDLHADGVRRAGLGTRTATIRRT